MGKIAQSQLVGDNKFQPARGLPAIIPDKHTLNTLIADTRLLLSDITLGQEQIPLGKNPPLGIQNLIIQRADRALYLTILISDYTSRDDREKLLRELNINLKHLKELVITACEREYIVKHTPMEHLVPKIADLSNRTVAYAKGLEEKRKKDLTDRNPEEIIYDIF